MSRCGGRSGRRGEEMGGSTWGYLSVTLRWRVDYKFWNDF